MTYLRILRLIDAVLRRCEDVTGRWTFTDWRGHIAFRQIDYAKRVQKASGWQPVEAMHPWPRFFASQPTTTVSGASTVTYRHG